MSTVLLTGATGFVGRVVLDALLQDGFRTAALLRDGRKSEPTFTAPGHCWLTSDALAAWFAAEQPSAVIHIATAYGIHEPLSAVCRANVLLPLALLEQCAERGCKLFISTDTFYGKANFHYAPMAAYATSKRHFTELAKIALRGYPTLRFANLRLEHVYGEGDSQTKFVPSFVERLLLSKERIAMTDGLQQRDFIHVDDVASAFVKVARCGAEQATQFQDYEVGRGEAVSIRQFAELAHRLAGSTAQLDFGALAQREGEIVRSIADPSAMAALGWQPAIGLSDGLRRVVDAARRSFLMPH